MTLVENAANVNLKFIYFWLFVLLDDNGNGVLTYQDFFRVLEKFSTIEYVEKEIYELVKWMQMPQI